MEDDRVRAAQRPLGQHSPGSQGAAPPKIASRGLALALPLVDVRASWPGRGLVAGAAGPLDGLRRTQPPETPARGE